MDEIKYFHFIPISWPQNDKHLTNMRSNPNLESLLSPMFVDTISNSKSNLQTPQEEWNAGVPYSRSFSKFLVQAFCETGNALNNHVNMKYACGMIYFSNLSAGAPGLVHGGALSTVADIILGDFPIMKYQKLYFTRTLTVEFLKFIKIDSVVRFDVQIIPSIESDKPTDVRVQVLFTNPADKKHVHVKATGIFALARSPPIESSHGTILDRRQDVKNASYQKYWENQATKVPVPSTNIGWWPITAREISKRLENMSGPTKLCVSNMLDDFPQMKQQIGNIYGNTNMFDCGMNEQQNALQLQEEYPMKILRKLFWRKEPTIPKKLQQRYMCGVYLFTSLTMGPPGRVHGGAIATACDDIQGQLLVRERGFLPSSNTLTLQVQYFRPTMLNIPYIMICRLKAMDDLQTCTTEGVLLAADIFFNLSSPFEDCFEKKVCCVRSVSTWKRPKAKKVGMKEYLDYDQLKTLQTTSRPLNQWSKI